MNTWIEWIKNLGTQKLIALLGVLGMAGWLMSAIADRIMHTPMVLLATDLYPADAGKIVTKIESLNIPFEIKGDGTTIYVPQDQVLKLRMQLAEEGVPAGSMIGNEIFDRNDTLGMTSFLQDVHQLRALEGEIARTIASLKPVASARVHLVIPKKSLFSQDHQDPTASIILKMRYGGKLQDAQVQAIQHLVASAVPGLKTEAISIVDQQGTLLAKGSVDAESSPTLSRLEELHVRYEERLGRSIEALLEKTLGPGKVKAKVSVDMDHDRITENAELFDPEGQVVRSSQSAEDGTQSTEQSAQAVTVQNNLPTPPNLAGGAPRSANNSKKSDETVNYEISKTIRNRVKEVGGIKRLSVAVLVDGHYQDPADPATYTPRSEEEMDQIRKLVSSAIGFQEERGDRVDIINMKFTLPTDLGAEPSSSSLPLGLTKAELLRLGEIFLLLCAALGLGFFVLRPMMRGLAPSGGAVNRNTPLPQSMQRVLAQSSAAPGEGQAVSVEEPAVPEEPVDYKIKKTNLNRIEEMIKQNPEESVSMLRNWIHGEV